jgi:hypothetical protein
MKSYVEPATCEKSTPGAGKNNAPDQAGIPIVFSKARLMRRYAKWDVLKMAS